MTIEKSSVQQRQGMYLSVTRIEFVLSFELVTYIVSSYRCPGWSHLKYTD